MEAGRLEVLTSFGMLYAHASFLSRRFYLALEPRYRSALIIICRYPCKWVILRRSANGDPVYWAYVPTQGFSIAAPAPAPAVQSSARQDQRAAASRLAAGHPC